MPSPPARNQSSRNQWTRLDRLCRVCRQKEKVIWAGWLQSLTDAELEDLIRQGEIRAAVAGGLLPDDAWTQGQARLWAEAMNRAKAWAQAGGNTG